MYPYDTLDRSIVRQRIDPFAGVAPDQVLDQVLDPQVCAEVIGQWLTRQPEFASLPRTFTIALSGSPADLASVRVHDIGLKAVFDYDGRPGFTVVVGGASGRTPIIGHVLREFLPAAHLLTYLDAILRVCNRQGRRDDKRKARITMLLKETGVVDFRRQVEHAWSFLEGGPGTLPPSEIARIGARRVARPVHPHRMRAHAAVTMSLNRTGVRSGDISSACAGR